MGSFPDAASISDLTVKVADITAKIQQQADDRFRQREQELMQQIHMLAHQQPEFIKPPPYVPDWGWNAHSGNITALGMLFLRLKWKSNPHEGFNMHFVEGAKFIIGDVAVIDAIVTSAGKGIVYALYKSEKAIIIEDDGVFPSDTLIQKILLLKEP